MAWSWVAFLWFIVLYFSHLLIYCKNLIILYYIIFLDYLPKNPNQLKQTKEQNQHKQTSKNKNLNIPTQQTNKKELPILKKNPKNVQTYLIRSKKSVQW